MNKRKQRMSSTVDKYMENKIIQYLEKDIKNKQVTSDSWGPGSHWLSVPHVTITCPQQRNNRHASYGILILMSLLQHINKRWAKNSTSVLSKEVHAPLYPSHPKKKKKSEQQNCLTLDIRITSLKVNSTYSKRCIWFSGNRKFYTNFASKFSAFKRRILIFLA